jgi:hypothetical protein
MSQDPWRGGNLLAGALVSAAAPWPLSLPAVVCDLRRRFIAKCRVGDGYRSVSRNGRVLLCADRPLDELAGRAALVRVQGWHKPVLPGDRPEPYGLLLFVRAVAAGTAAPYTMQMVPAPGGELSLDVGGGLWLEFHGADAAPPPHEGGLRP